MAEVVVLGSGLIGLASAMLLAHDGHRVAVLERDPEPPPPTVEEQCNGWTRRGVTQFGQAHFFTPRMRQEMERELPDVVARAEALGARRTNLVGLASEMVGLTLRDGDERFETLTGRRPVIEAAFAMAAAATDGVEIRRGVTVAGLLTDGSGGDVPNVVGVRTEDGEELRADVVVDATGRRSPLPRWLADVGGGAPDEDEEDVGFVYFGRHFRGELPEVKAPLLTTYPTNSILTLPCDNDTWVVGIIALGGDAPLRGLLDTDAWMRTVGAFPHIAHWVDAEPIEPKVKTMSKMHDRVRRYVTDGRPVATGVLAVGDSWACSNPSLGRGTTIGVLHAIALRDAVRKAGTDDGESLALAFEATTSEGPKPWLDMTLEMDKARKAEIDAALRGEELELDPSEEMGKAFLAAALVDPEMFRHFADVAGMLAPVDEVVGRPGVFEKAIELGLDWRNMEQPGPSREELLELVGRA